MRKYNLYALVAAGLLAGGLSATSASAADLGGNCCADLEERIAELEATTVRKGNRKVSLTVSGWVNQQVTWWDDGVEDNVYVHDVGSTLGSHVKFTGSAQISPGWSAGYVLQIEAMGSDGLTIDQDTPDGPGVFSGVASGVQTLQSYWFIKSDYLGKVSVGKQSAASDNAAILVDGSGSLVPANWVAFDQNSFFVRNSDGTLADLRWGAAGGCAWGDCAGLTSNAVRYDSPIFGGFSVSASWGEDDFWDVAGRFAGEHWGWKYAASVAYSETSRLMTTGPGQPADSQYLQAGAFLMHAPTGLFAYGAYGRLEQDSPLGYGPTGLLGNLGDIFSGFPDGVAAPTDDSDTWYVKGGWRSRWSALGHTVFYGEYMRNDSGAVGQLYRTNCAIAGDACAVLPELVGNATSNDDYVASSELNMWGVGVVQEIDAAAMSVWLKYRHSDVDITTCSPNFGGPTTCQKENAEDFQYVGFGGLINF